MKKLIKNWKELSQVSDSETHSLDVLAYNGWIINKSTGERDYLSTHTFYGSTYKNSTKLLNKCGFDVQLVSWDEQGL